MSEVKTRKVRKQTNLGKIFKSIPILPVAALALSNIIVNSEKFKPQDGQGVLIANVILIPFLLEDAYRESKKQFFGYSKKLSGLEELALWTTAFSVLRNEAPDVYQTFSGTSFDQAYGRQR